MKNLIGIVLIGIICFSSCDYIKNPIENTTPNTDTAQAVVKRNILLEEFTGEKCPNCPAGALEVEHLDSVYGNQLIDIEIHAGYFATPDGSGDFTADYRTTAGTTYNSTFGVGSYPSGMVSRIQQGGIYPLTKNQWDGAIQSIKDDAPIVKININNTYDSGSRQLTSKITSNWLQTGTTTYKLEVYITEDHLVSPQQDGANTVQNYDHRHVLRGTLNGTWGDSLLATNQGDSDIKTYNYTLPSTWNDANCSIIAYIYDADPNSPNYYEIYQVSKATVKQ